MSLQFWVRKSIIRIAEVDRWMAMGKDVRYRYQDVETETTSLRVDLNAFLVDDWIAAL